jgi:phosphatidylinositol-3-phosphatase
VLAADQCYCLSCGARCGPRPPALERILASLRSAGAPGGRAPGGCAPPPRPAPRPRGALPGARVAAVLTLAMLAFGTATGAAASNPSGALSALRRGPLTLLLPAHAPAVAPPAAVAPPPVEAASTPEPVETPPAAESTPTKSSESASAGSGHKKSSGSSGGSGSAGPHLPPVKHVFLIVLADEPYAQTFGPESPAPYLAHTLERRGELLVRFYAVAHEELADEIALVSGLGPTPETAADCPVFKDIVPAVADAHGQYTGQGCIYPPTASTFGDQLTAKGLTWRVYAEGMGAGAPAGLATCRHPEFDAPDPTSLAPEGDSFATFRDPFTYFDGVLHSPACAREDVGLEGLASDLKSAKRTPSFSYIVPDLCHDGRPTPCAPGAPSGLPAAEAFLRRVVPEILAAPAYRHGGLLIVTTDQAPTTGEYADSSSCCEQPRFPAPLVQPAGSTTPGGSPESGATQPAAGTPGATGTQPGGVSAQAPTTPATTTATTPATTTPTTTAPATTTPAATAPATTTTPTTTPATTTPTTTTPAASAPPGSALPPRGGGQVGALLLSPYVKPGTFDQEPFNDFSLLHTIENLFGLPPLGYAAQSGAGAFEASVFSAYTAG